MKFRAVATLLLLALSAGACGGTDTFTEAPHETPLRVSGKATFKLMVMGDFGVGNEDEQAVSDAMKDFYKEFGSDAIVTTGDNVYPSGEPEDFKTDWSLPFGWVEDAGLRVITSLGNHDYYTDAGKPVMKFFHMPGPYYEASVGDADIFVLNANAVLDPRQSIWLKDHLAKSKAAWQIVVFHHPTYSCARHNSTPSVIETWVPIFESEGVDLVLNGHDHNYQRFGPVNGVTYVVTGGGGNFIDEADECPTTIPPRVAQGEAHHFLALEGSKDEIVGRIVGVDEATIDQFSLHH